MKESGDGGKDQRLIRRETRPAKIELAEDNLTLRGLDTRLTGPQPPIRGDVADA